MATPGKHLSLPTQKRRRWSQFSRLRNASAGAPRGSVSEQESNIMRMENVENEIDEGLVGGVREGGGGVVGSPGAEIYAD